MWIIWSHLSKNICSFIYNLDLRVKNRGKYTEEEGEKKANVVEERIAFLTSMLSLPTGHVWFLPSLTAVMFQ